MPALISIIENVFEKIQKDFPLIIIVFVWVVTFFNQRNQGKQIEGLKSKYKNMEIKFETLHANRVDAIKEIQSLISRIEDPARLVSTPIQEHNEPPKTETLRKLRELYENLYITYNSKKIWLPENTCNKVDNLINILKNIFATYETIYMVNKS